ARMPRSKYKQYKGCSGTYGAGSRIHDLWVEHFECGFWIAGYDPPGGVPVTEGLVISNCRIRNNYADGVNFSQGTSHSVVENCSIRNNGDDGMAVWPNDGAGVRQPCIDDTFRNNTVEDNWRAAGSAIFGGWGHSVDHNLFIDGVGGSGIRMTNDFSGFGFDSLHEVITVADNTIVGSGTRADIWDRPKGAIEIDASKGIFRVRFVDNEIDHSQWEPVHVVGKLAQVVFQRTKIDGRMREVKVPE
ncbi:MAG TPA: right-handed parallel beta-helix repeat-containing protein, partial [Puia sp.]|nr:right-handed parallel beta-helix repeat-containing protein [Puia sp.]